MLMQEMHGLKSDLQLVTGQSRLFFLNVFSIAFSNVFSISINTGSWTIVDGSHIPVSFSGLTAGNYKFLK